MLHFKQAGRQITGLSIARGAPPITSLLYADDLLICGMAAQQEVHEIKATLSDFCTMSGQLIGANKSRIWFSRRTTSALKSFCMNSLQAIQGDDNHIYLGVPIQASKCCHFDYMLEKIDSKLSVWKAKLLSPAAKVVLIKTVVEPMSLYSMGAGFIPESILQRINTKIRAFFWNSGAKQKMRLVAWEKITAPKNYGGLGLRDVTVLNQAMTMKILWKLASRDHDEALWVQVLRAKYLSRSSLWLAKAPTRCSKLWHAVLDCRQFLQPHIKWILGNGMKSSLIGDPWHHFWLRFTNQSQASLRLKVADCVDPQTGEWISNLIISAVGFHGALFLACVYPRPPLHHTRLDCLIFTASNSGEFSFRGACKLLQSTHGLQTLPPCLWKAIWRCTGILPRIRLFLWKLMNDAVPVKSVFARMLRTHVPPCEICGLEQDNALHALFLCPRAKQCWLTSSISLRVHALPTDTTLLIKWLSENLTDYDFMCFANHLWAFWKARCKQMYEGMNIDIRQAAFMANSYTFLVNLTYPKTIDAGQIQGGGGCREQLTFTTGLTCMMDGSYHHTGSSGWAYTLFDGSRLLQYGLHFGTADSPPHAEALAMLASLKAALAAGWSTASFLTDCQALVKVVQGQTPPETADWTAYITILELIAIFKQQGGFLCHFVPRDEVHREHNLANYARISHISTVGYSFPSFPPN
ncbi:hypothetical protein LUZ63_003548 [Rhynchospora breviuscula]|uniref:Reverse transcriptase zinc-binding domain-containing protein n=1 Tax=Rhynchospora breviuscula TaxID=2022672 RepID=A0A9Q0HYU8_9POAL|nr:hypothetical protein LUZ63_003548 [Rhynchospora breviuscula]